MVSLTEILGEQKSRHIKKGAFYLFTAIACVMVVCTIYAVNDLFKYFYWPGYATQYDKRWNILWIILPILGFLFVRLLYKYSAMRSRMIQYVTQTQGTPAVVDLPVKPETLFSINEGVDNPLPMEQANAMADAAMAQKNAEFAELEQWTKAQMLKMQRENNELKARLAQIDKLTEPRVEVQGFQQFNGSNIRGDEPQGRKGGGRSSLKGRN